MSRHGGALVAARVLVLAAALPAVARAAPDLLEARRHHALGEAHLKAEQFREAIAEFEEAFKWSGQPEMLYNVATVYRRLGMVEGGSALDLDRAIDNFRRFLALRPRDRDREHIERWIDEMSQRAARLRSRAARPSPVATEVLPDRADPRSDRFAAPTPAPAAVAAPDMERAPSAAATPAARPLAAEIGLGAGIVAGAVAAAAGGYALAQDGTPACHLVAPATHCPSVVDSALPGALLVGIGGALVLGSAAALAVIEVRARHRGRGDARASGPMLLPVPLDGGAALVGAARW